MIFIRKLYRQFSILNLALSILFLGVAVEIPLLERFFGFVAINLGYHTCYWFFANVFKFSSYASDNFGKAFWRIGSIFLIIIGLLASILIASKFISDLILFKQYLSIYGLCIPAGIFLGASFSWIKMRKNSKLNS